MSDIRAFKAALNNLDASWTTFTLARLFGKKVVADDSGMKVTMKYWKGKFYLMEVTGGAK